MYDDIPAEFRPLFTMATETCIPREAKTEKQAHDEFRYEWYVCMSIFSMVGVYNSETAEDVNGDNE